MYLACVRGVPVAYIGAHNTVYVAFPTVYGRSLV